MQIRDLIEALSRFDPRDEVEIVTTIWASQIRGGWAQDDSQILELKPDLITKRGNVQIIAIP